MHPKYCSRPQGLFLLIAVMLSFPSFARAEWTATSGMPGGSLSGTFSACGKYVLYGSPDDGIYRSTDEGATWAVANTGLKHTGIRTVIAASPVGSAWSDARGQEQARETGGGPEPDRHPPECACVPFK
jgi:hypothetical protein